MSYTIGCYPELLCRKNGKYVSASNYFKSASSFGLDDSECIAEVKPGFSESPIDLTAKNHQIIEYGHDKHPDIEFISGHYVDQHALGGHIHVGLPPKSEIIDSMDTVLYALSNSIDDRDQRIRRERSGYGKRKAWRNQAHGFEYRTPGSWLLSPSTTLVTLTLAKLSILAVAEDGLDLTELKGRQHSINFLRSLRNTLKTIPPDCEEGLKEMDTLLSKSTLDWNQNILPNWGFRVKEAA